MICQVAVVTGSNRGIGLAIAEGLADAWDGDIFITSRDEKKGKEVCFAFADLGSLDEFFDCVEYQDNHAQIVIGELLR